MLSLLPLAVLQGIAKAELEHLQCVEAVDPKKPGGHCDLKQLKASIENALAADVGVVVLDDFTTLCRGNSLKAALQFLQFLKQDVVDSEVRACFQRVEPFLPHCYMRSAARCCAPSIGQ